MMVALWYHRIFRTSVYRTIFSPITTRHYTSDHNSYSYSMLRHQETKKPGNFYDRENHPELTCPISTADLSASAMTYTRLRENK